MDQLNIGVSNNSQPLQQTESRPLWMKIANKTLFFLIISVLVGSIGACLYFFNQGGDAIWMILPIAFLGSISLGVLLAIRAGLESLHFIIKKR